MVFGHSFQVLDCKPRPDLSSNEGTAEYRGEPIETVPLSKHAMFNL